MLLNSKTTTIAYRCPCCGKFILGVVGVFTLSGDLIKLKCDCGGSELIIEYISDNRVKIKAPCLFCPSPHTFCLPLDSMFERDILALTCNYSNLDVCFIGDKDSVLEAAKEADNELLNLLDEAGFDDLESFLIGRNGVSDNSEDNVSLDYRLDYAQIEEVVHFMLTELADEGAIRCGCKEGDTAAYDFEFKGDSVRIFCHSCGHEKHIPMSSTLAANAFLHIDELVLENKGDK